MLNVFLGYRCNFACDYCLQVPGEWRESKSLELAENFAKKVAPIIKERKIESVQYWGGEPLLYIKQIARIQDTLVQSGCKVRFARMSTNGSLFNEEIVEEVNRLGIHTVISRHPDFGEPKWDRVSKLNRVSIAHLFHKGALCSWPHFEFLQELQQKFGRRFHYFAHWVHATSGCDPKFYFDWQDVEDHVAHLFELADLKVSGHNFANDFFQGHIPKWKTDLEKKERGNALCHGDHHINVDLHGFTYGCHHSVGKELLTGHLYEEFQQTEMSRKAIRQAEKNIDQEKCKVCPIQSWCKGQCHLSKTHEIDCYLSKKIHEVFAHVDFIENGETVANKILSRPSSFDAFLNTVRPDQVLQT